LSESGIGFFSVRRGLRGVAAAMAASTTDDASLATAVDVDPGLLRSADAPATCHPPSFDVPVP